MKKNKTLKFEEKKTLKFEKKKNIEIWRKKNIEIWRKKNIEIWRKKNMKFEKKHWNLKKKTLKTTYGAGDAAKDDDEHRHNSPRDHVHGVQPRVGGGVLHKLLPDVALGGIRTHSITAKLSYMFAILFFCVLCKLCNLVYKIKLITIIITNFIS